MSKNRPMKQLFLIFLLLPLCARTQNINTIAGTGTSGHTGDGGPAILAELQSPWGVAMDNSGNLFFADAGNNCIRKISIMGVISTIAGNGTAGYLGDGTAATAAELNTPTGIATDGAGNIYVADYWNNRIRKISTAGIITTIAGNGTIGWTGDGAPATNAELNNPSGVAVDTAGNVYVADNDNFAIRKVDGSGIITTYAGQLGYSGTSGDGGMATAARIGNETSVYADKLGNLFIADRGNSRIRVVNAAGIISTEAGNGGLGYSGDGGPATAAQIGTPYFSVTDSLGNLYISDVNGYIRKVGTDGIISTLAGNGTTGFSGDGGPALLAIFHNPYGIAVDKTGNIYIADGANNRIRKIAMPPHAGFSAARDTTCQDSCITFVNTSTGPVDSIRWVVPGITLTAPHSDTINVCFPASGSDSVILYTYGGGVIDTTIQIIDVKKNPHPHLTFDWMNCTLSVPDIYLSYHWYNTSGMLLPYTSDSIYASSLFPFYVVVDSNDCYGSSDTLFACTEYVKNVGSPVTAFTVSPNPAIDILSVSGNLQITSLEITNLSGQIIFAMDYQSLNAEIDISRFPPGMYFIKINGFDIRKFIKE